MAAGKRWSVGTVVLWVIVVTVIATTIQLGFWQLRRSDEIRTRNAERFKTLALEPVAASDLFAHGEATAYRRVEVTGTFDPESELLIRGRADAGVLGFHVITPLRISETEAVLVNRGWVPFDMDEPPVPESLPPDGEVTVTGYVLPSEGQQGLTKDPEEATPRAFHVDTERLARQVPYPIAEVFVALQEQTPAQEELPRPIPLPDFDDGPHLYYALQWFGMAIAAFASFMAFTRKTRRERAAAEAAVAPS